MTSTSIVSLCDHIESTSSFSLGYNCGTPYFKSGGEELNVVARHNTIRMIPHQTNKIASYLSDYLVSQRYAYSSIVAYYVRIYT